MATFSVGFTGSPADFCQPGFPGFNANSASGQRNLVVEDAGCQSAGQEQQAMSLNTQVLCRGPDGQFAYYTYDAERSIPGVSRVLKRV